MTKFTRTTLLTLAVSAVGLFLGSPDVLAMPPTCAEDVPKTCSRGVCIETSKTCGDDYVCIETTTTCIKDACVEATKTCIANMRPTLKVCQAGAKGFGLWAPPPPTGEGLKFLLDLCLTSTYNGVSFEGWKIWHCFADAATRDDAVQCMMIGAGE